MPTKRGTSNRNLTGNSYDRRARYQWLLDTFGDGETAECQLKVSPDCPSRVDWFSITVNRIVPGCQGGTYRRDNIEPACGPCNSVHGGSLRRAV